jgi:LPPG:FO 2-phospho-L-lactate transferase
MAAQGLPCSIVGVAHAYEEFIDVLICDNRDNRAAELLRANGLTVECTQTIMRTAEDKASLAREVLSFVSTSPADVEGQPHSNAFRRLDPRP